MCYHYWGFGHGWLIGLVIIGLIVWLATRNHYYNYWQHHKMNSDSAINILKDRYARGEIGKEEFEEKKKDLLK